MNATALSLGTNGSPRITVSSAGNVGVGTTSPGSKLEVNGAGAAAGIAIRGGGAVPSFLDFGNTSRQATIGFASAAGEWASGAIAGDLVVRTESSSNKVMIGSGASGPVFNVLGNGNVGVGTSAPSATLQTYWANPGGSPATSGTTQPATNMRMSATGGASLDFGTMLAGNQWIQATNWSNLAANYALGLNPNGGNVGIGTVTPVDTLQVSSVGTNAGITLSGLPTAGTTWSAGLKTNLGTSAYNPLTQTGDMALIYAGTTVGNPKGFVIAPWTNAPNSGIRMDTNGSVGIGGSPAFRLDVNNGSAGIAMRLISSGADGAVMRLENTGTNGRIYHVGSTSDGSGAGTGYSIYDVTGSYRTFFINAAGDGAIRGCMNYNGGTMGTCLSDARLKKNVRPFELGLSKILGIRPVFYRYNGLAGTEEDSKDRLGVIAQEVEKVAPELIETRHAKLHPTDAFETEFKAVNYNAFMYMAINAIREIYEEVTGMKAQVALLEKQNAALKAENAQRDREFAALKARMDSLEQSRAPASK
ncbi:MAG: hypothetical protein EOP11_16415 [Proteobacteria bacterium]|nr:MAG: hypothetical protein EOP11_16415 [Pseudomonadota bacterium]